MHIPPLKKKLNTANHADEAKKRMRPSMLHVSTFETQEFAECFLITLIA